MRGFWCPRAVSHSGRETPLEAVLINAECGPVGCYLAECINSIFFKSHPPHKNINVSFTLVKVKNMLTDLWGSGLSKTN